jgi:hypothetical protein
MKLSSPFFFVLSSVVGTVLIAAEPCANGYGKYDMTACNSCAENGNGQTGHSVCCNAIYRHSLGRDDDDFASDANNLNGCSPVNKVCGPGDEEWCYPGLICVATTTSEDCYNCWGTCQVPTDNPEAHAAASLVTSSSSTSNSTTGGPSFVLVVVGLLGAAIIVMTVVLQRRHRGLLRRHQYNEVDATPIAV